MVILKVTKSTATFKGAQVQTVIVVDCADKNFDIIHLKDDFSKGLENKAKLSITEETNNYTIPASLAQFRNLFTVNK